MPNDVVHIGLYLRGTQLDNVYKSSLLEMQYSRPACTHVWLVCWRALPIHCQTNKLRV